MQKSELQIDVIETFSILQQSLANLKEQICVADQSLPGWFLPPMGLNNPYHNPPNSHHSHNDRDNTTYQYQIDNNTRKQENAENSNEARNTKNYAAIRNDALEFINQLEYIDTQEPKEILVGAGIFAASKATIAAINQVNSAKNKFKQAILALKTAKIKINDQYFLSTFEEILNARSQDITTQLRKVGLARLHLKQCYRKIPILNHRPKKVTWTWANTKAIKKIDVNTAQQMLEKHRQDQGIQHQLAKLQTLNPNEPLAIVQELAPHLRANILIKDGINETRFMLKGSLPIFYLDEPSLPTLPEFIPPEEKKEKNKNRQIRSDVRLDPEPFLPAIRVHRYNVCNL